MTEAEKLARMVLLFYSASPWSSQAATDWKACAGNREVTTRAVADQARKVLAEAERAASLVEHH
jgi:hypothetical protein